MKELESERRSHVLQYEDGYEGPVVHFRWRFRGTFKENLELYFFPFDVQVVTLINARKKNYNTYIYFKLLMNAFFFQYLDV